MARYTNEQTAAQPSPAAPEPELQTKSALGFSPGGDGMSSEEAEINALYSELHALVERACQEPALQGEVDSRIERLRLLQKQEASKMRERFEARRRLKPGSGWELLRRIEERLSNA